MVVIPNEQIVSQAVLRSVAAFRSKFRLPVLTWKHNNGATLTRCAQPLSGVKNKRNSDDEFYLSKIVNTNDNENIRLSIVDARPKANAIANRTRNGGYESEDVYKSEINFVNIHSIHVMRESLNKLKSVVVANRASETEFSKAIEGWLKHINVILQGVRHVIERLERGIPVLVHCSDGWDRTSQLCALSMLLLDPYYRTLVGFEVLIEKEWLSFGHKFQQRIGHGDNHYNNADRSPIFLQFIDCVSQLLSNCPDAFEFNEYFLITIADHMYSCRFGTFLFDTERERTTQHVKEKTISLWTFVNFNRYLYINVGFKQNEEEPPITSFVRNIKFWENYYCRWMVKSSNNIKYEIKYRNQSSADTDVVTIKRN